MNELTRVLRDLASTSLEKAKGGVTRTESLEALLAECMDYGKPVLHCHDDLTWSCAVTLNSTHAFLEGRAHSNFHHRTPTAAVEAVLKKLRSLR